MGIVSKTGGGSIHPRHFDEFSFAESLIFAGKGFNPVAAFSAIREEGCREEVSRNEVTPLHRGYFPDAEGREGYFVKDRIIFKSQNEKPRQANGMKP